MIPRNPPDTWKSSRWFTYRSPREKLKFCLLPLPLAEFFSEAGKRCRSSRAPMRGTSPAKLSNNNEYKKYIRRICLYHESGSALRTSLPSRATLIENHSSRTGSSGDTTDCGRRNKRKNTNRSDHGKRAHQGTQSILLVRK